MSGRGVCVVGGVVTEESRRAGALPQDGKLLLQLTPSLGNLGPVLPDCSIFSNRLGT